MSSLDKFLCLEEALEVPHLPDTHEDEDHCLTQRPPQHTSICAITDLTETLFTDLEWEICLIHLVVKTLGTNMTLLTIILVPGARHASSYPQKKQRQDTRHHSATVQQQNQECCC